MRRRLVVWVVPLLMLAAATVHWIRVETFNQSPWVGGAFGMFATVDGPYRVLEVTTGDDTRRIATSGDNETRRAATSPTEANLRRLAAYLEEQGVDPLRLRILSPTFRQGYLDWEEAASYEP